MGGEVLDLPEGYDGWTAPEDHSDEHLLEQYASECRLATAAHAGHLDVCRELADGGQRLVLDEPTP